MRSLSCASFLALAALLLPAAAQEDSSLLPPDFSSQKSALAYGGGVNASTGTAQSTPASPSAAVPSGAPVGEYNGPYRPQVHFSPPMGFMNDPNGLFRSADGTWHLYYQYNPTAVVAGNQHWGHATSSDLYHWTNQPIAIYPPAPGVGVFSGSAVVDTNNTSGFFPNSTEGVVAIYTLNYPDANGSAPNQVQAIAYSTDHGHTFTPYAGNPVLDISNSQFRDPKVIRYGDMWVMVVALSQEYVLQFYTSPDLKTWRFASNFSHYGLLGLQYECPNLVQVRGPDEAPAWLLILSNNPGMPGGGSGTQYFAGDFNGTHFVPHDGATRLVEWGKDAYAGQVWYNPGTNTSGDTYYIAWASNWQYCEGVPTAGEGWRSQMTLPRAIRLTNAPRVPYALAQTIDLGPVRGQQITSSVNLTGTMTVDANLTSSGAVYADITISGIDPGVEGMGPGIGAGSVNWTLSNVDGEALKGGYNLASWLWVSRRGVSGYTDNPLFTSEASTTHLVDPATNSVRIQVVWDRSLLEVFADETSVSTTSVYPAQPFTNLNVQAVVSANTTVHVEVYALNSVWDRGNNSAVGGASTAQVDSTIVA